MLLEFTLKDLNATARFEVRWKFIQNGDISL